METYRIHFEHQDGTEDSFVVSGASLDEVRRLANAKLQQIGGLNPWAEEVE